MASCERQIACFKRHTSSHRSAHSFYVNLNNVVGTCASVTIRMTRTILLPKDATDLSERGL